jgi:hypothetical protein
MPCARRFADNAGVTVAARQAPATRRSAASAFLFRHSVWLFAMFALAMLAAFWPSYFSRLTTQASSHAHQHGAAMILWCGLLVAQAWLIRSGRRAAHRALGTVSYALVPLIVLTTVRFIHFRVQSFEAFTPAWLYALALILNTLAAFLLLYGLAIHHRRSPGTHARWMVCTVVPLFPPVTDRLIAFNQPQLVPLFPFIGTDPVLPLFGFALGDGLVAMLAVWDWRVTGRLDVFPGALAILLVCQATILTFHRFGWWAEFADWFRGLPLT